MRAIHRVACLSFVLLAGSLQAQTPPAAPAWPLSEAPAELREPISRASLIVLSMQDALLRELTSALAQGGPEMAVSSCHIDLIGAIRRVNRQPGVEAGRTSDRLRNSTNTPRAWAAPLVAANAGRKAHDVEGFVVDLGDKVGVLQSIAHRPLCASCHGTAGTMTPGVRAALNVRYPNDRAVGFAEGEIRGWFWVELPRATRR